LDDSKSSVLCRWPYLHPIQASHFPVLLRGNSHVLNWKPSSASIDIRYVGAVYSSLSSPTFNDHVSLFIISSHETYSSPSTHIPSTRNMSSASSSRLQLLFDAALQNYEKQTRMKLVDHPFAKELQNCHSVDSVMEILRQQARALTEFRGDDGKVVKSLKRVVHVVHTLSTSTILGEGIGLVRLARFWVLLLPYISIQAFPPAKALFAGFAVLLGVRLSHLLIVYRSDVQGIRRSRTSAQVTMRFSTYSNPSNTSSSASISIPNCRIRQQWERLL
jgi:hypothetical protein